MPLTGNPTQKQPAQQRWILGKRRTWWRRIAKGSPSPSCRPARAPYCTSRLYLGTGHSHYWAWRCTNKHTQCWHTLYIMSLPWYGPQPLLGLTLHKQTHTMLAHTVHHVFTLVRATATTGLDAAQTNTHNAGTHCTSHLYLGMGCSCCWAWRCTNKHTQCWHTLYITSLPWYGLQLLLGLKLCKCTHYASTHCTSGLYLCSHYWAWCRTNTHTMLTHTVHHVFTLVQAAATTGLDAAQTHTLCWHTLYITSLPWYRLQPLLGLTLHKHTHYADACCTSRLYLGTGCSHCWAWRCTNTHTHTMLTHAVHHVFTLVQATATAGLDAAQTHTHTLCWHMLYITSLPWYRPQPLLGLTLHKHTLYAGRHSFFLFFCPIICANLWGTAPVPLIPSSPPPATPKTHSTSRPITRCPQEEMSNHWWAAIWRRHCTAAESLRWGSLFWFNVCRTLPTIPPYWRQC